MKINMRLEGGPINPTGLITAELVTIAGVSRYVAISRENVVEAVVYDDIQLTEAMQTLCNRRDSYHGK